MARRTLRDLARSVRSAPDPAPSQTAATEADIQAAFRLLLGRTPDPDGAEYWRARVGTLSVEALVSSIMDSREFRSGALCRHLLETGPSSSPTTGRAELVEAQGLSFWVDPEDTFISRPIIDTGTYEPHVTAPLAAALTEGATFMDVGANIGWHTMHAARAVGPAGRVIAFEPDPRNIDLLLRSAWANRFDNVIGLAVALSDAVGSAVMQRLGGSDAAMFGADELVGIGDQRVTCVPLDSFGSWVDRLDVLKIDVEGADLLALRGAERLVTTHRPVIFFELCPDGLARFPGSSAAALGEWLDGHGYAIEALHKDGRITRESSIAGVDAFLREKGLAYVDLRLTPQ